MKAVSLTLTAAMMLAGCGLEETIRKNDDRYAKPGAMDPVIAELFYRVYQFNLLDRYRITHEWVNTSGCDYRASMKPGAKPSELTFFYIGRDVVELDGKTWHRSTGGKLSDFDHWVRSVKWTSKEKGKEGEVLEVGFKPLCFESWWTSSHYLRLRIQKRSLVEFERVFSERYPEGKWRGESLNGLKWRVQQVPFAQLRTRPLNGLGGPYQSWLTALGDSGYSLSIEMGASKESLEHPQAHADIEGVFKHLVSSLKVERLAP
ncbi:hypothetical protein [Hydrogenophaga sp.]|uniref:hypothetical protein n=1 Tax=Hydrogenophaga sp. TaxID=1904254 RepID=UPI002FC825B5